MKRIMVPVAILLSLVFCGFFPVYAGQLAAINLYDGSTVYGEIVGYENGIFAVRTQAKGTIQIREDEIAGLKTLSSKSSATDAKTDGVDTDGSAAAAAAAVLGGLNSDVQQKAADFSKRILADDQMVSLVMSLQNDPAFQKILGDPRLMKAVQEGDVATLMNDPGFAGLLDNSVVKQIGKKLEK